MQVVQVGEATGRKHGKDITADYKRNMQRNRREWSVPFSCQSPFHYLPFLLFLFVDFYYHADITYPHIYFFE